MTGISLKSLTRLSIKRYTATGSAIPFYALCLSRNLPDGIQPNPTLSQLKIAVAKMLPCSVVDRLSPFGQAERSIDGNEIGPCLLYRAQDVFIAERDGRLRLRAAKKTQTCRTARRPGEIDPEHNKRFFAAHSIRPQFTFLAL